MPKNTITINKPSAMIQTNVRGLSLIQRKFINALIHVAQKSGDIEVYKIPIKILKQICNISTESNSDVKDQVRRLQDIKIEYNILNKDKKVWGRTPLIGSVEIEEYSSTMEFSFTPHLRQKILNPSMYVPLDVILIAGFRSAYTIILYEFLRDYLSSPKIPHLTIEQLKKLFGIEKTQHKQFKYFRRDVLDKAIDEINQKSDIECSYELIRGPGNKYSKVAFTASRKKQDPLMLEFQAEVPGSIINLIPIEFQVGTVFEIISPYLNDCSYEVDYIASNIKYSARMAKDNFPAYLKEALANDYARAEREINMKKETLNTQAQEAISASKKKELEEEQAAAQRLKILKTLSEAEYEALRIRAQKKLEAKGFLPELIRKPLVEQEMLALLEVKKISRVAS